MTAAARKALSEPSAVAGGPSPAAVLPQQLKDKGWKLEVRTINDDEQRFIVKNEALCKSTDGYEILDDAIVGAIILQNREDGNTKITPKQAAAELKGMRAPAPLINSGEAAAAAEEDLSLGLIRTDGGTQPRGELDQQTIDGYHEAMKARLDANLDYTFPRIDVFHDGKHYWLADGFHRFFAFKKVFGHARIPASVHQGTKRDAVLFSLGANETHGKRRSDDDKRRAVLRLLEDPEWKQWSDSAIAGVAKVSQPFVSSIRREIEKPADTAPTPLRKKIERAAGGKDLERFKSPSTKKIGKDKVARETAKIGKGSSRQEAVKVTDRRRVTETGVARNSPSNEGGKKAQDIQKVLKGRPLAVSFTYIPGMANLVSVSVHRGKAELASRETIAVDDMPAMPPAVQGMITQQLKGGGAPEAGIVGHRRQASKKKAAKKKPAAALAKKRAVKKR
jgi:hypothetical protein